MSKFNLDKVIKKLEKQKVDLPKILANDALRFFNSSFTRQGWEDSSLIKWKQRLYNRTERDETRKILVDSGTLRRAVSTSLKKATWNEIVFKVEVDYAEYHNTGTSKLPKRQFMGDSKALREKQLKKIKKAIDSIWQG